MSRGRRPLPRRHTIAEGLALIAMLVGTVAVQAADLKEVAVRAFTDHAQRAQQAFVDRAVRPVIDGRGADALRSGRVAAEPGSGDGILNVDEGLVHHWRARVLLPGVRLDDTLTLSRAYDDYPRMFKPIRAARILDADGDRFRVLFRMQEAAGGLSATLQVRSAITYTRVDRQHAYVISRSEEIRELKDPGRVSESLLPEGKDNGYLWRAATFTRWVEDSSGVWMEMETLGLSREFPPLLGWVIEPIARRIGRRSAETSVDEFRHAVATRLGTRVTGYQDFADQAPLDLLYGADHARMRWCRPASTSRTPRRPRAPSARTSTSCRRQLSGDG